MLKKSNLFKLVNKPTFAHDLRGARTCVTTHESLPISAKIKEIHKSNFGARIALTCSQGFVSTALGTTATLMMIPHLTEEMCIGGWISAAALGLGAVVTHTAITPTFKQKSDGEIVAHDPLARKMAFHSVCATQGVIITPLLIMAHEIDPVAIPIAAVITGTTVAGMVSYALSKPTGSLLHWGPPLITTLVGLLGIGIVNIFIGITFLHTVFTFGSIGVFALLTAYDVHAAMDAYDKGKPDHYGAALDFYLSALNLFINILKVVLKTKNSH